MDNKNFESLYSHPKTPEESFLPILIDWSKQFPETDGAKLSYIGDDVSMGVSPSVPSLPINQQMHKDLVKLQDDFATQLLFGKPEVAGSGGVEPPLLVTSGDMADELEALPVSMRELILDPDEQGISDEIIGELRRQGDEVAVAIEAEVKSKSLYDKLVDDINPYKLYTNQSAGCIVPNSSNNFTLDVD